MDSLTFPLHSIRLKIECALSWTKWFFKCTNPILKFLGIITCCDNCVFYIALTAFKVRDTCLWYLDSGCFMHMIGNKALFKTLFERNIGTVTFGDGSKSVIWGIETINIPGLPMFEDV